MTVIWAFFSLFKLAKIQEWDSKGWSHFPLIHRHEICSEKRVYGVIGGRPDNGFPVRSWNYRRWSSQRIILWAIVLQWYIFKCLKTNFQNSKSFIWQSHHIANRYIDKSNNFENPIDFVFLQYDFISLFHMWQTRYAICMLYYVISFYIFKI